MTELIDGIWKPVKPPYENPPIEPPTPPHVLEPKPEPIPGQPVVVSTYASYVDKGKIVVKAIIRNLSGMQILNLPVWAQLKQDVVGVGARYGYLSIETKPRYINLKGNESRSETFFFEDDRIKMGQSYIVTVYYEFHGRTYSSRVRVTVKYRQCTGTDFREDRTDRIDVTNVVKKYRKNVKSAVLEIYRGTAQIVKYMPSDEKTLYEMWTRGYTIEKKVCPLNGATYYVQYACKLLVYTGNERSYEQHQVNTNEKKGSESGNEKKVSAKSEGKKKNHPVKWEYAILGLGIAAATIYFLRRR